MLRAALLLLSRQRFLRDYLEHSKRARALTARFVAGETLADARPAILRLHREGFVSTLDYLGENVTTLEEAEICRKAYGTALELIHEHELGATVSIKPSQFGLDLSPEACLRNLRSLLESTSNPAQRIEIDMESSAYTDRTLQLVHALNEQFPGRIRAVIQAYLRRSADDVEALSAAGIRVRLCKGAYRETPVHAFPRKAEVDENYLNLARILLMRGTDPAIATHDPKMISAAKRLASDSSRSKHDFEFQMLYGIRRDLQEELKRDGFRLRLYVPFGQAWFPYFMRRLAERPANLWFVASNLLRS